MNKEGMIFTRDLLLISGQPMKDELLATKLLNMVIKFCGGSAPHFPIKKVLLLLWKVILVSLGGSPELRELKGWVPFHEIILSHYMKSVIKLDFIGH
jgi:hypothetical protein